MKKNSFIGGFFSLFLILISLQNSYSQSFTFDSLANEINKTTIFNKTKSLEMLGKLYQMARQEQDSSLCIARCLYEESLLNFRQGIVDSLLTLRIKNKLKHKQLSLFEQAVLESGLGTDLMSLGEYAEAFPLQFEALEKFKQLKLNRFTARTLISLGNICYYIDLLNLANSYYFEALEYITPDYHEYYATKTSIFLIAPFEVSVDSMLLLVEIVKQKHFEELLPLLYLNIGSCFIDENPEKAFPYFMKMYSLDFDNSKWRAVLHAYMGSYYLAKKNNIKALQYFQNAQKVMEENHDFYNLSLVYHEISSIYEQQKEYTKALFFSRKSQEVTLRLRSNLTAIETYQKYIHAFLKISKDELIIAEQTIKLKHKQSIIITIVAVFALLVILLLLFLTHQQKLRKASENRELKAKLEHEKRVQQYEKRQRKLEKEKQEAIIDAKTREITSYSMLVSNKNQMLKQIRELIMQIFDNKNNSIRNAQKIDEIIQNNLTIDEEWENFKMHFDKVHPHFFEKLKQHCDYLTEENLKMCAYIKMRMTTKQIAQLLQVVPNSIITSRYRLKKKLQLADYEELDYFIGNL